jgi:hypothetical protein
LSSKQFGEGLPKNLLNQCGCSLSYSNGERVMRSIKQPLLAAVALGSMAFAGSAKAQGVDVAVGVGFPLAPGQAASSQSTSPGKAFTTTPGSLSPGQAFIQSDKTTPPGQTFTNYGRTNAPGRKK